MCLSDIYILSRCYRYVYCVARQLIVHGNKCSAYRGLGKTENRNLIFMKSQILDQSLLL